MIMNVDENLSVANGRDAVSTLEFTKDQQRAYDGLIKFINSPYDPDDYKRALIGAAGTGKTFLVRTLIKNCNLNYSKIGLGAPTHKACRVLAESISIPNIKTNTLQSDLGLRLNFDIEKFDISNPPFDPKGKIKILHNRYSLYIVDEASMINRSLCMFLERTCKNASCKIIYIGDSYQLPPVKETHASAFRNVISYTLNEIVRQEKDNPIINLLSVLRDDIRHKTYNFLNYISKNKSQWDESYIKGYHVCNPQEFTVNVYNNFRDEQLTVDTNFAKIVAYTNNCVSAWNKFVRNNIISDADKAVITKNDLIISYVTLVDQFNDTIIKNSEEYIVKDIVNYVHPRYNIKGFMVTFIAIHGGQRTIPLFVVDHKDMASVQSYLQTSKQLINYAKLARANVRAQKWKDYYAFRESCLLLTNIVSNSGEILYRRDLDYGFALTSHKSQGSTFDTTFVDVNDIVYDKNGRPYNDAEQTNRRLYVACSRCRNKLYLKFG